MDGTSVKRDGADPEALATELGEAIAASPTYRAFEEAREAVEADEEAQRRIEEFEERRHEFALARERGEATATDARELEGLQSELHALPVMEEFFDARDDLRERLDEINEAVSAPLSVDVAGEAGGCCHD